ncbi:MAG: hypothetical protein ACRD3Z_01655 [Nitrososphaerales archaeon]
MQTQRDSVLDRFQLHLNNIGVDCGALPTGGIDIDNEFKQKAHGNTGTMNVGSFKIFSKNIDYINLIERLEYDVGSKSYGRYSRSEHVADQWQARYFLQTDKQGKLAPLDVFTESRVEKGFMHSKVVDTVWKGSGKMTTLPVHIQNDDLLEKLNNDQELKTALLQNLISEKLVRVKSYTPKSNDEEWKDYVVIFGEWRDSKNLPVSKECFHMYDSIARIIRDKISSLKYW